MKFFVLINLQRKNNLEMTSFMRNKKFELRVSLKFKVHILLCRDNYRNVTLRQVKFRIIKDQGHTYTLYLNHYFV
jgi:hypothetical protein